MRKQTCVGCGEATIKAPSMRIYCAACTPKVRYIQDEVKRKMLAARVPEVGGWCADCGAKATMRDHRYYSSPLHVDMVCSGCNVKRGPARDISYLIAHLRLDKLFTS
jgi:hypothetical protein